MIHQEAATKFHGQRVILMLSYSGTQMMPPSQREGLLDDMEAFINDHFDGQVTRPLVVTLTTATLS